MQWEPKHKLKSKDEFDYQNDSVLQNREKRGEERE